MSNEDANAMLLQFAYVSISFSVVSFLSGYMIFLLGSEKRQYSTWQPLNMVQVEVKRACHNFCCSTPSGSSRAKPLRRATAAAGGQTAGVEAQERRAEGQRLRTEEARRGAEGESRRRLRTD